MSFSFSLKKRFLFLSCALLIALIILSTFSLERVYHKIQYDTERQKSEPLLSMLIAATDLAGENTLQVDVDKLSEGFFNQNIIGLIQNDAGETLWQSSPYQAKDLPQSNLSEGDVYFKKLRPFSLRQRFIARMKINWQSNENTNFNVHFIILETAKPFIERQKKFRSWAVLSTLLLGFIFIFMQYYFIGKGFKPLDRIQKNILAIRKGSKNSIDSKQIPSEMKSMVTSLNQLLQHQDQMQQSHKEAVDDLAHSLKTPLSALKSQLQITQLSEDKKMSLNESIEQADNIIKRKLSLLRERSSSLFLPEINIMPIIEKMGGALKKIHHEKNVIFTVISNPKNIRLTIHADDMFELMGNILENSFSWCTQKVSIQIKHQDKNITLSIQDDGPGFKTKNPNDLLARGKKLDEASSGTGLGLYISEKIVQRYQGKIELSNHLSGALIVITFPTNHSLLELTTHV